MDMIAEQVSSANFLTSANITWTNASITPWKKMLFSPSSRFGRVSYCLQSRQHLPLSTLQSKSRAVHFRAVCQVVTASGSISWLRISTHTSSSTNVPPAYVDRLRWGKCSLWQNRSESPPNGPLMHHCIHKKEVGNSTWPLPQVK